MNAITPFNFESKTIRVVTDENGEPLFVGKDVCETLGYTNHNKAMNDHCKGVTKRYPLQTDGGMQEMRVLAEPDVYRLIVKSELPEAQKFEAWFFEEVLPTIRKTGSYSVKGGAKTAPPVVALPKPTREFKDYYGIAKLIGLDKNAAAIAANQAVIKLTGTDVLQLLEQKQMQADRQDTQWFTPTELGGRINASARSFNLLLAEAGLQMKRGEVWEVTDAGREFARLYDTGKKHGSGVPIQQIKWSPSVTDLLKTETPKETA